MTISKGKQKKSFDRSQKIRKKILVCAGKIRNFFFWKNLCTHTPANQNDSKLKKKTVKTLLNPPILRRDRNSGPPKASAGSFS